MEKFHSVLIPMDTLFDQFTDRVEYDLLLLKAMFSSINETATNLSLSFEEHKKQTADDLGHLHTSLTSTQLYLTSHISKINNKLEALTTCTSEKEENDSVELVKIHESVTTHAQQLSEMLSQHKEQIVYEFFKVGTAIASSQSSMDTIHSKLELLAATTAQLSYHHSMETDIASSNCSDRNEGVQLHQNLRDNLSHQLEVIQQYVDSLPVHTCGGTGGWRRVVYLNMTDPSATYPSGWQLTRYSKRTCGRVSTEMLTCDSAIFPVGGGEYTKVCGKIKAYQFGRPLAFFAYHRKKVTTIDHSYVCGVSLTHGLPRNHIWTFGCGETEANPAWSSVCPCDASIAVHTPPFIGKDYFCESGINEPWDNSRHYIFHPYDPLWDGENCLPSSKCCSQQNPPYFVKQLPTSTTDNIEVRICWYYGFKHDNIAVELFELYVQ